MTRTFFTELCFQEGKNGDKEEKLENNIYVLKGWMPSIEGWRILNLEVLHKFIEIEVEYQYIALFNKKFKKGNSINNSRGLDSHTVPT